ncbi:MAG: WecB/TagA/CpsF family glycosyltransferase, partial [Proteobacteria bacterium]|nr:WecB/TagA/CpsF family glycosyltransferase [Pseudomonadota bacterium]
MTTALDLLPPAPWSEVVRGRADLIGSRLDPTRRRGRFSPIEARVLLGLAYDGAAADEAQRLAARSPRQDLTTLVSAVVAQAIAPAGRDEPRPWIVAARVDNVAARDAVARIVGTAAGAPRLVCFVHPHALNLATTDAALRATLARADLVLPDGVGIRIAARLLGVDLRHNVNGTDLLPLLCDAAATASVPIVLVGAAPGIADACAMRLRALHPTLTIPVVSHGFLDDDASRALATRVRGL